MVRIKSDARMVNLWIKYQLKKPIPRTRGGVPGLSVNVWPYLLFPAHAGVLLPRYTSLAHRISIPRTRGGVSVTLLIQTLIMALFPAHAGVFLSQHPP